MKKVMTMAMAAVVAVALCGGCSSSSGSESSQAETQASAAESGTEGTEQETQESEKSGELKAAFITPQALGDGSVTDLSYEGFTRAAEEFGYETQVVEVQVGEYEETLRSMAQEGYGLLVCLQPELVDAICTVAPEYPDTIAISEDFEHIGHRLKIFQSRHFFQFFFYFMLPMVMGQFRIGHLLHTPFYEYHMASLRGMRTPRQGNASLRSARGGAGIMSDDIIP